MLVEHRRDAFVDEEGTRARPWETARRVLQAAAVNAYGRPGLLNLRPSWLLLVFHGRFGHQIKATQRTHKFGVRLFSGATHSVDRRVVAILGPRNGLGDVGVSIALGPFAIDVEFHLPSPPYRLQLCPMLPNTA